MFRANAYDAQFALENGALSPGGILKMDELKGYYRDWVSEGLGKQEHPERQSRWTESMAVGREGFVREVKEKLGARALWREIAGADGSYELREPTEAYDAGLALQNEGLGQENAFFWNISI